MNEDHDANIGTDKALTIRFREVVSHLIPSKSIALMIARDAGLLIEHIPHEGSSESLWNEILDQGNRQGQKFVWQLVRLINERYPSNEKISAVYHEYSKRLTPQVLSLGAPEFWQPPESPRPPKYENLQYLGEGGFGRVFRAFSQEHKTECVLKIAKARTISFRHEIEATGFLPDKDHFVKLLDSGVVDGHEYLAMPFVGRTLKWHLQHRTISFRDVPTILDFANRVAIALGDAHSSGVVHCDLKPSNILLDSNRYPVLCDFGMSRLIHQVQFHVSSAVRGTICYLSPEQLMALDVGPKTDMYSFGVVIYELLTGNKPFGRFPDICVANPSCPVRLQSLVNACLDADPRSRPKDFVEIQGTLDEITATYTTQTDRADTTGQVPAQNLDTFMGQSPAMRRLRERLLDMTSQKLSIYLVGQTGVGKTQLARLMFSHRHRSPRDNVTLVDLAQERPSSHETLLFGSNTFPTDGTPGATDMGLIQKAKGGTLFLDEIHALSIPLQESLADAMQGKGLGSANEVANIAPDIQLTVTSRLEPSEAMARGVLSERLFRRFDSVVRVPSLRERKTDVFDIIQDISSNLGVTVELGPMVPELLLSYDWPGNISELESFLESCIGRKSASDVNTPMTISVADFQYHIQHRFGANNALRQRPPSPEATAALIPIDWSCEQLDKWVVELIEHFKIRKQQLA